VFGKPTLDQPPNHFSQPHPLPEGGSGGAGVGRWTLEIGPFLFCVEVVTSGQIRILYA